MSIGGSSDKKGSPNGDYTDKELVMGKVTSSPNGEKVIISTRTDKELAKLAGVGTGTVARFNKVMNSDDEGI